jgi:hypothetical protein
MRSTGIFFIISVFSITVFGQDKDQNSSDSKEPEVKTETKKEYDEDGNLIRYDSVYTWKWNDNGVFNEKFLENFEDNFDQFHEKWEDFGEEFMSKFYLDDEAMEKLKDMQEDFKFDFKDSALFYDHFEKFFEDDRFQLHGFNFNGENLDEMPFDKEKMDEMHKRMKDLLNGEFDERIKKFIEEHRNEIDEIRYQIIESIPNRRKAI